MVKIKMRNKEITDTLMLWLLLYCLYSQEGLELSIDSVYPKDMLLDMPKRPPWDYTLTTAQLDDQEQSYFKVGSLLQCMWSCCGGSWF